MPNDKEKWFYGDDNDSTSKVQDIVRDIKEDNLLGWFEEKSRENAKAIADVNKLADDLKSDYVHSGTGLIDKVKRAFEVAPSGSVYVPKRKGAK